MCRRLRSRPVPCHAYRVMSERAPWDPHAQNVETTGHGLKLRMIDPCFSDLDLGQTVYGAEARLQLGCSLGKKPARGDLFDSLARPRRKE